MTPPRPGGVGRTPLLARTDSRARALFLLLVAAIVATGIGTRLAWWQIVERDQLVSVAMNQLANHELIPAERGEITDASGVLLATSVELQSVFATPPSIEDPESAAALLAPALGMDMDAMRDLLTSEDQWVWLKRRVDLSASDRIRDMDLAGIGMLPETKRVYPVQGISPRTTLAAQVIGFVNVDGEGQYGIESAEDDLLAGLPGIGYGRRGRDRPPDRRLDPRAAAVSGRIGYPADHRRWPAAPHGVRHVGDLPAQRGAGRHRRGDGCHNWRGAGAGDLPVL